MAVMVQDLFRARGVERQRPSVTVTRSQLVAALSVFFAIVLLDAMLRPLAGFDFPVIQRVQAIDVREGEGAGDLVHVARRQRMVPLGDVAHDGAGAWADDRVVGL